MNIDLRRGSKLIYNEETVVVVGAVDLSTVLVKTPRGEVLTASIADLASEHSRGERSPPVRDPKRVAKVEAYLIALGHLLDATGRTREKVGLAAEQLGISISGAYRALKRYDDFGTTDELPPPTRPGGRGKARINAAAEAIIQENLQRRYPGKARVKRKLFLDDVERQLAKAGHSVSRGTISNRLSIFDPGKPRKSRAAREDGSYKEAMLSGEYPATYRPLEVVQGDHWRADMEILDPERLHVIGRYTLTLVIDIYSRMIYAVHVGLDPPGTLPIGLAMINGMTRKDWVSERYGIKVDNPIAGVAGTLHLDNAGEFDSDTMHAAARHFNFKLMLRPVLSAEFGGHIERLIGTFAGKFKSLPGATGSNPDERKQLRPEKSVAMTLEDATRHVWLLIEEYHNTPHAALGMTPLEKYRSYFFGPHGQKHHLPRVFADTLDLRIPWYPKHKRNIGRRGIVMDYLEYMSDDLAPLYRRRKELGKLEVRVDPLDVRHIYLRHPDRQEWLEVPNRIYAFPEVSLARVREAKREALAQKRQPSSTVILEILEEQERNIDDAVRKTRTARRRAARDASHADLRRDRQTSFAGKEGRPLPAPTAGKPSKTPRPEPQEDLDAILARLDDDSIDEIVGMKRDERKP